MSYIDGVVAPVKTGTDVDAYRAYAEKVDAIFLEYGATRVVDGWGSDVPHGKQTDLYRAVAAEEGEVVIFSWIEWPDKATRDTAWDRVMADERMQPGAFDSPIDMKRMIFGGFDVVVDQKRAAQ